MCFVKIIKLEALAHTGFNLPTLGARVEETASFLPVVWYSSRVKGSAVVNLHLFKLDGMVRYG